jgi:hypothetical protein
MTTKTTEKRPWTVMVYMAGDNNLSIDMAYALREMQRFSAESNDKFSLFVYYDNSCLNSPTLYCDFRDPKNPHTVPAREFDPGKPKRKFVRSGVTQNSATMRSLYQFAYWCLGKEKGCRNGRSARNALIVSGHGSGFQNLSFLKDDRYKYYMTVPKFRETLKWIDDDFLAGKKLDLIGFDNCVMGMLEIGNELRHHARVMVASEGYIPNAGWPYARLLTDAVDGNETAEELGKRLVQSFITQQADYAIGGVSVDIAAWNLQKLPQVSAAVDSLAALLDACLSQDEGRSLVKPWILQAHYECQSYMFEQNVDVADLCRLLGDQAEQSRDTRSVKLGNKRCVIAQELALRCAAVEAAIRESVLLSGFSGGKYQYSNGISIFFPWTLGVLATSSRTYSKLDFAQKAAPRWKRFLWEYLARTTRRPPKEASTLSSTSQKNLGVGMEFVDDLYDAREEAALRSALGAYAHAAFRTRPDGSHRVDGNPRDGVDGNPRDRVDGNPRDRVDGNPRDRIDGNPRDRVDGNPRDRVDGNPRDRVDGNPRDRVDGNPRDRVEGNPRDRVEGNPRDRVDGNPRDRVDGNPRDRVEGNPKDRSIDNVANRMLGAIGMTLIEFKNASEPWFIYGFSNPEVKVNTLDRGLENRSLI